MDMQVRTILDLYERVRPTLDLGPTFWCSPHKRTWRKEAFALCLHALTLAGKLIHPVAGALLCFPASLEPNSLGFQYR